MVLIVPAKCTDLSNELCDGGVDDDDDDKDCRGRYVRWL